MKLDSKFQKDICGPILSIQTLPHENSICTISKEEMIDIKNFVVNIKVSETDKETHSKLTQMIDAFIKTYFTNSPDMG
jgi:hypothetical protein